MGGLEDSDSLDLGDEDAPMSLESLSANTKLASSSWKKEAPSGEQPTAWKSNLRVNTEKLEEQPVAHIIDEKGDVTSLKGVHFDSMWFYQDKNGQLQGPYSLEKLNAWVEASFFAHDLKVKPASDKDAQFVVLSDAIQAAKQNKESPKQAKSEHHEHEGDEFGDEGLKSVLDVINNDDHEEHGQHIHPIHQHMHSPLLAQQFQHTPTGQWQGNFQRTPSGGFVPYNYQQPQHSPFHQPPNIDVMFNQPASPSVMHVMQQQHLHQLYMMQMQQQAEMQRQAELQRQQWLAQNSMRADQLEDELKQALNLSSRSPIPQAQTPPPNQRNFPLVSQQENPVSPQKQQHEKVQATSPPTVQEKPVNAWGSITNPILQQETKKSPARKETEKKETSPTKVKKTEEKSTPEKQQEKTKKQKKKEEKSVEPTPQPKEPTPQPQERKEAKESKAPQQQPKPKPEPALLPTTSPTTSVWGNAPSVSQQGDLSSILKEQQKQSKKREKEKKKTIATELQQARENVPWGNATTAPTRSLLEIQQEEQQRKKQEEEQQQQQSIVEKTSFKGKVGAVISGSGIIGNIWGAGAIGTAPTGGLKQIQQEEQAKKKEKKDAKQQQQPAPQQQQQQQPKKKPEAKVQKEPKPEPQKQPEKKQPAKQETEEEEGDDFFWDYDEEDKEKSEEPSRAFTSSQIKTPTPPQPVAPQPQKSAPKQKKKKESKTQAKTSFSYASALGPSSGGLSNSSKNDFPALGGTASAASAMDDLFPALPKTKQQPPKSKTTAPQEKTSAQIFFEKTGKKK
jgi:hypothetical protein